MSLKDPIVEGAYYECNDGLVHKAQPESTGWAYENGRPFLYGVRLHFHFTRRVYLVPTDPADVVAELRSLRHSAMTDVANWLAAKLGVK